jgi:hypothetical protein
MYEGLRSWYEVRDTLLGANTVKRNVKKALQLAASCHHEDAVWLTKVCSGCIIMDEEDAHQVFLEQGEHPRALCFAGLLKSPLDLNQIKRSAELGCACAQACMASEASGDTIFCWAKKAAAQGERDWFFWLGYCYILEEGCQFDLIKAKENYLLAAEAGHVYSMSRYCQLLDVSDPQRYVWRGRAASQGDSGEFLNEMVEQMHKFNSGCGSSSVVFEIGKALKGHVNFEIRQIFGVTLNPDFVDPANQAIRFYEFQLLCYRKALDCWSIIAKRCGIVKDIRIVIGNIIWQSRKNANYVGKNI